MGEIPPTSKRTKAVLEKVRETQAQIESYRATIVETRVTQLSNGSELRHVRTWNVSVKYTDGGVLTRIETWSSDSPDEKRISVTNRTASIIYDPAQDEYLIDENGGTTDRKEVGAHQNVLRSRGGSYNLFEAPTEVIQRENAIHYNGTAMVDGQETYVIYLDGNPNGGTLAYYDAQTIWVDTDTGLVLKQTAQKPRTEAMGNLSLAELRNPRENSPHNDSDDDPDAVYLGDKTITTRYTNVSVNSVSDDVFTPNFPEDADIENVTGDR